MSDSHMMSWPLGAGGAQALSWFLCQPLPACFPCLRLAGGGRVINTNCSAVRTRQALCCKMSVEYDKFIESGRKYAALTRPTESPEPSWVGTSCPAVPGPHAQDFRRPQVVLPRGR